VGMARLLISAPRWRRRLHFPGTCGYVFGHLPPVALASTELVLFEPINPAKHTRSILRVEGAEDKSRIGGQ
jgi:hypothetical protein